MTAVLVDLRPLELPRSPGADDDDIVAEAGTAVVADIPAAVLWDDFVVVLVGERAGAPIVAYVSRLASDVERPSSSRNSGIWRSCRRRRREP